MTFVCTAGTAVARGAQVVFADIDPVRQIAIAHLPVRRSAARAKFSGTSARNIISFLMILTRLIFTLAMPTLARDSQSGG